MAKVFTIPALPGRKIRRGGKDDPKYLEGQRLLAEAIRYLTKTDPKRNRPAIELLFQHFETQFRASDTPLS